jgi:hypothetical protein
MSNELNQQPTSSLPIWKLDCSDNKICSTQIPKEAIFSVTNAVPGQSWENAIQFHNQLETGFCNIFIKPVFIPKNTNSILPEYLEVMITDQNNQEVFLGNLNLLAQKSAHLGTVVAGENKNYQIKITFADRTPNHAQSEKLAFKIQAQMSCQDAWSYGKTQLRQQEQNQAGKVLGVNSGFNEYQIQPILLLGILGTLLYLAAKKWARRKKL